MEEGTRRSHYGFSDHCPDVLLFSSTGFYDGKGKEVVCDSRAAHQAYDPSDQGASRTVGDVQSVTGGDPCGLEPVATGTRFHPERQPGTSPTPGHNQLK